MAMGRLADLYVEIRAKGLPRVKAGLAGIRIAATRLGRAFAGVGQTVVRWGRRMAFAMAAFAAYGIREALRFDDVMDRIAIMLEDQQMHLLPGYQKAIRAMAIEFGIARETVGRTFADILSASIPADKALQVLRVTAIAAKGGLADMAVTGDALTTIMNSYGMSVDKAADVTDWMAAIVKKGKIWNDQLAQSIGAAASTASLAGLKFNEFGALIATMTRKGQNAHMAMTGVNGILRAFLKSGDEAKETARGLGFELNTTTLRTIGLTGVIKKLTRATAEEISLIFPNIRGLRGLGAALQDVAGYEETLTVIRDRAGRSLKNYNKTAGDAAHKFEQLRERIKDVAWQIGERLMPELERFSDWVEKNAPKIEEAFRRIGDAIAWVARNVKWLAMAYGALKGALIGAKIGAIVGGPPGALVGGGIGAVAGGAAGYWAGSQITAGPAAPFRGPAAGAATAAAQPAQPTLPTPPAGTRIIFGRHYEPGYFGPTQQERDRQLGLKIGSLIRYLEKHDSMENFAFGPSGA